MANKSLEAEATARKRGQMQAAGWTVGVVVVIIVFILLAKLVSNGSSGGGTASSSGTSPAPASLVAKVTSLEASVFAAVGQGSATSLPKPISAPALTQNGKPQIVYLGAEYCPYCATERWPMVIALSRFGSFSNLQTTHSSSSDVYPSTQTFSFHGASYSSPYIAFTGVETYSNVPQGSGYAPLDTPTSAEQSLLNTYDAPPYVSSSSSGAIPFVDFGGKYLISGASYSPQVLQGKSADQIASALSDPSTDISKGAVGTANAITAAICKMTNDQPGKVCGTSVIQGLEQKLGG
ncbi:MAG TPA: DUF929 family protein [Candidatus Saccharimonadales bacterium]|nr:DUF929 family protein [Candidatus Saccharimonadales bacterium]